MPLASPALRAHPPQSREVWREREQPTLATPIPDLMLC